MVAEPARVITLPALIHMQGKQLIPGVQVVSSSGKAFTGGWQICRLAHQFCQLAGSLSDSFQFVDNGLVPLRAC